MRTGKPKNSIDSVSGIRAPVKNHILIKIAKSSVNALIDTGAVVSLIRQDKLQNLDRRAYTTETLSKFDSKMLTSADYGQIPVLGKVSITVNIGGIDANIMLLVVEKMTTNILFGKDVLDVLAATIDCANNVVYFFGDVVQLKMNHLAYQHSFAYVLKDTKISPGTEKILPLKLQRKWSTNPHRNLHFWRVMTILLMKLVWPEHWYSQCTKQLFVEFLIHFRMKF